MSERRTRRSPRQFSEDFKLSVLQDYYESGRSRYFICKKYQICKDSIKKWFKEYPLSEIAVSLSPETQERLLSMAKKTSENPLPGSPESRIAELESRIQHLLAALEYSELRVEAYSRAIKFYNEQEGVDVLKKAGSRQQ